MLCGRPAAPGAGYCSCCKCETCPKGKQSVHGAGRWRTVCGRLHKHGAREYANRHGVWHFLPEWSQSMRCATRAAFVTLSQTPADAVERCRFLTSWSSIRLQRLRDDERLRMAGPAGRPPPHGAVFFLCLVALMKWPIVVRAALRVVAEMHLDPDTATAYHW